MDREEMLALIKELKEESFKLEQERKKESLLFQNCNDNEKSSLQFLEKFLKENNIPKDYFSINRSKEGAFCILKYQNKWITFYQDGNHRTQLKPYGNCCNACINLVNRFSSFINSDNIEKFKIIMKAELTEQKRVKRLKSIKEIEMEFISKKLKSMQKKIK